MNIEIMTALTMFAFVSSITPGPNNLMLMSSGANFGFKLTIPHMFGVSIGFTLMVVLVGLGVMQLFEAFPISYEILKVVSVVYLFYLAAKIAMSSRAIEKQSGNTKPFSFIQAALFQWVNPKAWTMAITAISLYAPSKSPMSVIIVALVFGCINLPCICSWIALGQKIQLFLKDDKHLKVFNFTMAALLIASLYPAIAS